jgi:hypothetical protein
MAPAVGILLARRLEDRFSDPSARRACWIGALLPATALGLAIAWADFRFAKSAREAANLVAEFGRLRKRPVWFQGDWGFQYYMQLAGAQPMDQLFPRFEANDLMVVPTNNANVFFLPADAIRALKTLDVTACRWLATMHVDGNAGFYSTVFGPLPFVFGPARLERYFIYELLMGHEAFEASGPSP